MWSPRSASASVLLALLLAGCAASETERFPSAFVERLVGPAPAVLIVDVDATRAARPPPEVLAAIEATLTNWTAKSLVEVRVSTLGADWEVGPTYSWTSEERAAAQERAADLRASTTPRTSLVLHVIFAEGTTDDRFPPLGYSEGETIWIFPDAIRRESVPDGIPDLLLPSFTDAERNVMIHEIGHSLGLVNNGAPMLEAREHPQSPHHSTRPGSVMYVGGFAHQQGEPAENPFALVDAFDAADQADLDAFRARLVRTYT